MSNGIDIYNTLEKLKNANRRLEKSELSTKNKKIILKFQAQCIADGLSTHRVLFYTEKLMHLAGWLGKNFDVAKKKDILALVQKIEQMDYEFWTKLGYKMTLKKFYRWLRNTEEYPEEVKWIKTSKKNRNHTLPEELVSEDDVKKMIENADNPRDKAIISILYESGCRIGEICSLKIKNVQFDRYGAILIVDGKTGSRRVRIISSTPYLSTWLNNHPLRNNPNAPLWVGVGTKKRSEAVAYGAMSMMLKRVAAKAQIKKEIHPHLLRHSRATRLATQLTEAQMNEYFGWVQGSAQPSTYVHLSGRDVDKTLLKMYGLDAEPEKIEETLKPKKCVRCDQINPATAKFCVKCGAVLDVKTAIAIDEEIEKIDKIFARVLEDEKVQKVIMNRLVELGIR